MSVDKQKWVFSIDLIQSTVKLFRGYSYDSMNITKTDKTLFSGSQSSPAMTRTYRTEALILSQPSDCTAFFPAQKETRVCGLLWTFDELQSSNLLQLHLYSLTFSRKLRIIYAAWPKNVRIDNSIFIFIWQLFSTSNQHHLVLLGVSFAPLSLI